MIMFYLFIPNDSVFHLPIPVFFGGRPGRRRVREET
jgi:hypothetical protein